MATAAQLTWDELVHVARRTGVENWRDPASGVPGRLVLAPSSWRGKRGTMGSVVGTTRHHTGTAETFKPAEDYPTYQVVKEGRTGLYNSLSAYGLGRWTGLYVFSEFLSWHAGLWSYGGITDGNGHFLGVEAEGTGARWTPFQREFYPRLSASILSFVGSGTTWMPRHLDGAMPRGRKNDAANLWPDFTEKVAWYLGDPARITYKAGTPAPQPIPLPQEEEMLLIRNEQGKVVLLGDNFAEWVPSIAELSALTQRVGPSVQLGNEFFDRLVAAANGTAAPAQ